MTRTIRVVSLLPSATELIAYIIQEHRHTTQTGDASLPSIDAQLVGVSHECDHPEDMGVLDLPHLTSSTITFTDSKDVDAQVRKHLDTGEGLYSVDVELLKTLQPDVIVTQSLCKVCSVDYCVVESLASGMDPQPRLVDTNPQNLEQVLEDITKIGEALCVPEAAKRLRDRLEYRIATVASVTKSNSSLPRKNVALLEWTDPIFVGGHWTPQLLRIAGAEHPLNPCTAEGQGAGKSITVEVDALTQSNPDIIIIAPCGLNMEKTLEEAQACLFSKPWWKEKIHAKVYCVDGNQMFNRPGPRLVDALEWLCHILQNHPSPGVENFPAVLYNAT